VRKFVFACVALLVAACSNDPSGGGHRSSGDDDPNGTPKDGTIAPSGGSVRAPYQVKTSAEIATALDACFGKGVTTVAATMIQTPENPAGFLAARQFTAGADVVAGEASIIDGDPSVERTGVRNAALSLPILASLQDIGNVVGENCAAARETNALCNCATKEAAHAMLGRCLPSVAPDKYAGIEDSFASTCATDTAAAISSLLASTAFGVR
jgi:hypothetical protein